MSRPTRAEAAQRAGAVLADFVDRFDSLSPRQAAEYAAAQGGRDVDELEAEIRAMRGLSAKGDAA